MQRSASLRRPREAGGLPRRRGRARGAGGRAALGARGARADREEEVLEAAPLAGEDMERVPRQPWPHGPRLRHDFADGWDGRVLLLDPSSHLSYRYIRGLPRGNLRTFSGYTSVFRVYKDILSAGSRRILAGCVFGRLIDSWAEIAEAKPIANLLMLRAFLDRFWDTTTSFHLPELEAGITLSSFAVVTGLPYGYVAMDWDVDPPTIESPLVVEAIGGGLSVPTGKNRSTMLVKTSYILDYFEGKGSQRLSVVGDERNARLWLWWFLGATYFGDKGERVSTSLLLHLLDWEAMATYDWVTPALGLTLRYFRDAVRPDVMDQGSKPSLVYPGVIMESWVFAHFPSLLPSGFEVARTYPAVRAWATCDRSRLQIGYEETRVALNHLTLNQFAPRPWGQYAGVPDDLWARFSAHDSMRLYLSTPFGSFWYLGERFALQTRWARPVLPVDPPRCLFVQTSDPVVREQYGVGLSEALLLSDADYASFVRERLAWRPIEKYDPDLEHQAPSFPTEVEYEYEGTRRVLELPRTSTIVTDYGMDSWDQEGGGRRPQGFVAHGKPLAGAGI